MEKNTRTKNILLVVLLVAVLTLSISYAILTQQLTISSSATVSGGGWDVKFTSAVCAPGDGYVTSQDITQFNSGTVSPSTPVASLTGMGVVFHAPGDSVECEITVSNLGDIPATIDSFVLGDTNLSVVASATDPTDNAADVTLMTGVLDYSIVYATGDRYAGEVPGDTSMTLVSPDTDYDEAHLIPAKQSRDFLLTISYPLDPTNPQSLPTDDVTVSGFNTVFTYKQA